MSVTPNSRPIPAVLSIAGSDSGGGAGIQADLKAFARSGVHGMTAITAVTWQNTQAVEGVTPLPREAIIGQVEAVVEDIGVDAVKIGMLGTAEIVAAVEEALALVGDVPVVLDPVMVAESGACLLEPEAVQALITAIIPRATVITPNLDEARALVEAAGGEGAREPGELARSIHSLGPRYVVVTNAYLDHGTDRTTDLFFDGERTVRITGRRYGNEAAHGSGCTHASALAAHLALGYAPVDAARRAKRIASQAVRDGLRELGAGAGPVDALGLAPRRSSTKSPRATR